MPHILHWSPRSPFVRKVMIALHEKGLIDQVQTVRTWADPIFPPNDFFAVTPLAKIPTLEVEGGQTLNDSRVIMEWADIYGKTSEVLFPAEPEKRLATLRDEALGTGMMEVGILLLIELYIRAEHQQNQNLIGANRRKFSEALDHLEARIDDVARRPFDAGHVSIGTALCYYDFRFGDQIWRDGRPALTSWHEDFCKRPSVIATAFRDDPRPMTDN